MCLNIPSGSQTMGNSLQKEVLLGESLKKMVDFQIFHDFPPTSWASSIWFNTRLIHVLGRFLWFSHVSMFLSAPSSQKLMFCFFFWEICYSCASKKTHNKNQFVSTKLYISASKSNIIQPNTLDPHDKHNPNELARNFAGTTFLPPGTSTCWSAKRMNSALASGISRKCPKNIFRTMEWY